MLRVILDTNLLISFLISKRFASLDLMVSANKVRLLFSIESMSEFIEVSQRPKLRKFFLDSDLALLLNLFEVYGELVDVISGVQVCRDEKDNFLLALAKDGKANYLITGDEDLLVIGKFGLTHIVTFREFMSRVS